MDNYNEVLIFLLDILKTGHNDSCFKANGLFKQLKFTETYIILKIVISIFKCMKIINTILQSK